MSQREEALLFDLLARIEADTLERYERLLPELVTSAKRDLIAKLRARASQAPPRDPELDEGAERVLAAAASEEPARVLCVQGLVLETLGRCIYAAAAAAPGLGPEARALAEEGRIACETVTRKASAEAPRHIGSGEAAFASFAEATHDVIGELEAIAEPIDRSFSEAFDTHYAELMGDFTADLLLACVELGMPRRKVVTHFAGASMGF